MNWLPIIQTESLQDRPWVIRSLFYGLDGKQHPRLEIAVREDNWRRENRVLIGCGKQDGPNDKWDEIGIPRQLLPDVIKMLETIPL